MEKNTFDKTGTLPCVTPEVTAPETVSPFTRDEVYALAATGLLGPVLGALVHNAGSVAVIFNSALLLGWKKR